MWQDYYAHAISMDAIKGGKNYLEDPGPLSGDPYNLDSYAIPSSWNGIFDRGEHGNGLIAEPGARESDGGAARKLASKSFTVVELRKALDFWEQHCCINSSNEIKAKNLLY